MNAHPFHQGQRLLAMFICKSKRCEVDYIHGPFLLAASSEGAGRLYDRKPVSKTLDVGGTESFDANIAVLCVVLGGCHCKAARGRCCLPFPEAAQAFGQPDVASRRVV